MSIEQVKEIWKQFIFNHIRDKRKHHSSLLLLKDTKTKRNVVDFKLAKLRKMMVSPIHIYLAILYYLIRIERERVKEREGERICINTLVDTKILIKKKEDNTHLKWTFV